MVLEVDSLEILKEAVAVLEQSYSTMPDFESPLDQAGVREVLMRTAEKMQNNFPYAHPLYVGQMLKPPHPVARTAYAMAQWVNPNNHALDGGRASSALEKEAVANIAAMFGWPSQYLGHLTSGGTMANLEALWIAGKLHPAKKIVASEQAHYTHGRITDVLQIPFGSIAADNCGRMDMQSLELALQDGGVGTVVATLGTTGLGAIDPLADILALQEKYPFRIHVDCAYGGYFKIADNLGGQGAAAFANIHRVDSIVVDPHKHGLQPYGCGCVLFRDPSVGAFYNHDSPYTYFTSDELHLGEISLECSRAGASAVALWATQQLLPMTAGGEFARDLESSRKAALKLYALIAQDAGELGVFEPELDIVVWAPLAAKSSEISELSRRAFAEAARKNLHLAVLKLPATLLRAYWPDVEFDEEVVTVLRTCLMKPEHLAWVDRIWAIYKSVR